MNKKELKKLSLKEERSIAGGEGIQPMLKAYGGPSMFPRKPEDPQKNNINEIISSEKENLEGIQNLPQPLKDNEKITDYFQQKGK